MSEAKHTPGPWSWEYDDPECTRPIALAAQSHDVLLVSEDAKGPRAYVNEANARLIAAAPELLAELQRLEWFAGGDPYHYCMSCGQYRAAGHAPVCRLDAVLAKVAGEVSGDD